MKKFQVNYNRKVPDHRFQFDYPLQAELQKMNLTEYLKVNLIST